MNRQTPQKSLKFHHHEGPPPLLQLTDPGYILTMDEVSEVGFHLLRPGYLPLPLLLLREPSLPATQPDESLPEILPEHHEGNQIEPGVGVAEHVDGIL